MTPQLKITSQGVFELHNPTPELLESALGNGFVLDKNTKLLTTRSPVVVHTAAQYAPARVRIGLERMKQTWEDSRSLFGNSTLKTPHKSESAFPYFPYQVAGVEFMRDHKKCLMGDSPGTGKTRMTIGLINECSDVWKVLILCPASLRINWQQELDKWLIEEIGLIEIVSYDSAWRSKVFEKLSSETFDLVVMDEAQYVKHESSKRSMAAQVLAKSAPRVVLLTGTPVENNPSDLFPLLNILNPKMFNDFMSFARRYCNAFLQEVWVKGRLKKVWNTSGSSNEQELQDILRSTVMIRRLKKDVLPQLPKKIRQIIEIENKEKSVKEEGKRWESVCADIGYDEAVKQLEDGVGAAFNEMASVRQQVARAKVPYVIEFVENLLQSVEKAVIFAHHKAIVDDLMAGFEKYNAVKLVGGMSDKDKNASVERFQNDKEVRVFVGNLKAAGVGLTLTASSTVVFAEIISVPAQMVQCEDRCCRIGAMTDSVLIYHLVLSGSLDVHFVKRLVEKQCVADKILDV